MAKHNLPSQSCGLALDMPPDLSALQHGNAMCRQGGLEVDKVFELANGGLAKVVSIDQEYVVLDANNMLAGLERSITVEVLHIERPVQSV
jgi:FKBP-type peptidyl-prolyl cis-trans isomerase 2